MNELLEKFARDTLKGNLAKCTDSQQLMFKRMYSHKNLDLPIDEVVDNMPMERLDRAMKQVQRTLETKQ